MAEDDHDIVQWIEKFAACVREVDFDRARQFFDPEVTAFGTKAETASGLDQLVERQWKVIWPNIENFQFDLETLETDWSTDWSMVCVKALWSSTGLRDQHEQSTRHGRATILLYKKHNEWRARHTHFSISPERYASSRNLRSS